MLWYLAWVVTGDILYPKGPGSDEKGMDVFGAALAAPFVLSNFQVNQPLFGTPFYIGMEHQLSHFGDMNYRSLRWVEKLGLGAGVRIWKYFKLSGHAVANFDRDGFTPSYRVGLKFGEYAK